jgi:hypothetical protein
MCLPPELQTNTGIVVSGASREVAIGGGEESSRCKGNTVVFEISSNTVLRNRSQNISVTGGPTVTDGPGHHVQGIVTENSANDSPEGTGISIPGGSVGSTENVVHDITVSNNQTTGNFAQGILISGGTETINAVITGIDVLLNSVRSNGAQGILVSGGRYLKTQLLAMSLSLETTQTATAAEEFKQRAELPCRHFLP